MQTPFIARPRLLALAVRAALLSVPVMAVGAMPAAAHAQAAYDFDIPAGPLSTALTRAATQSGVLLTADAALTAGKTVPALKGRMALRQALDRLLAGSGLVAVQEGQAIAIQQAPATPVTTLAAVTVVARAETAQALPEAYAGGQVARGSRAGLLGNRDALDTPFNITGYTAELMENQQALTVADVLANDPAVRTVSYSLTNAAAGGDIFLIRGFSVQDATLFDGVGGVASSRAVPVESAERVEVLKGPNALLNGMATGAGGGVGGAINLVPKRASDTPLTRLTVSHMPRSNLGTHLDVGRRFGEDNRWGVRFNGAYRDGENATRGQSVELGLATVGIDYRGSHLRASLDAGHQTMNNEAPQGAAGFGIDDAAGLPQPPRADRRIAQDWEFSRSTSNYLLAKAEQDLGGGWVAYAAAGGSRTRSSYLSTDIYVTDAQGRAQATVYYWPNWTNHKTAQAGLRGAFRTGALTHELNVGAFYLQKDSGYSADYYGFTGFETDIHRPSVVGAPSLAGFSAKPAKRNTLRLPSLAISDTVSSSDGRVAVTVGARYQRVEVVDHRSGIGQTTYDRHAFTPVLAAVFKAAPGVAFYGNYIEGLVQGSTAPMGTTNAGEVFPPVKTRQHEVGVKRDFGHFGATLSAFQIEKPSGLVVANADGTSTYRVGAEQRNRGLEFQMFGEVVKATRLLGGVTYTEPVLTRTDSGAFDGNTAPNVSRWQLNLGAEHDLAAVPGLTLSARMLSTSAQYLDEANTRRIPGWTRWDMGARYATSAAGRPLVLRAAIHNVFGRDHWSSSTGNWIYLGQPRTLMLSASMDF